MTNFINAYEGWAGKIIVTGASGFVGRELCTALDNLNGIEIIAAVRGAGEIGVQEVVVADINSDTAWKASLKQIDVVMHLAARVHVMQDDAEDPLAAFRAVNLHGTVNLARQAAAAGVKRFVYVSSIKVNGECTDNEPFTESDDPNPQDPYGISKWEAEQALGKIGRETGMEIVIVRPPLVYGPGVKANFYSLLKLISKALPLPLGSIHNRRSMIYVGNLVDVLVACATHPAAAGQTYLVSDGEAVSTPQLVKEIATAMQRPERVFPFPLSAMRFCACMTGRSSAVDRLTQSLEIDSSKIRNELGWHPPYSRQQGLQVTADWFHQLNNRVGQ